MDYTGYRIFDIHTHAYPDNIAEKAAASVGAFYDIPVDGNGKLGDLIAMERAGGSSGFLFFSVATTPEQVQKINAWVASSCEGCAESGLAVRGFGAMHPDYPDMAGEVGRIISLGLLGVKLHPDFQRTHIMSEKLFPLYEACEGRLPIYFHAGDDRYDFSKPEQFIALRKRYPKLKIISAHLGGYTEWERFFDIYPGTGIYIDTSSVFWCAPNDPAVYRILSEYDADKIMFGTDYPVSTVKRELDMFSAYALPEDRLRAILYGNAAKLLGIL